MKLNTDELAWVLVAINDALCGDANRWTPSGLTALQSAFEKMSKEKERKQS